MANISLKLGKHPKLDKIHEVEIEWYDAISIRRLKDFLLNCNDVALWERERTVWDSVKDFDKWLYCFVGHIDDAETIKHCYDECDEKKKECISSNSQLDRCLYNNKIYIGTDIRLDFGKVDTRTIEKRIVEHFNDGDYLEGYRNEAVIFFPKSITPFEEKYAGDFIDSLETILIKGNKDANENRLGISNEMKIENPELLYPIERVVNKNNHKAMEENITVDIQ